MDNEKDQAAHEVNTAEESTAGNGAEQETSKDEGQTFNEQEQQAEFAQLLQMLAAIQQMDVYHLLEYFSSMLAARAWIWMGLRLDPMTGEAKKDLEQAKTAIDAIMFMVDKIAPKLEEPERRELRHMLSDLQMNFVTQSAKGE